MEHWVSTIIFLVVALLFAFLEIFIASGGLLAFIAAVSLLASIAFAFFENPLFGGLYTLGLILGVPLFVWYALRWWPQSVMGRRILLNPEEDPALQPNEELIVLKRLMGKRGVAKSRMMLSGLIEIDGKRVNAISESDPIEPGEPVVVVSVDGINVLVRKIDEPTFEPKRKQEKTEPSIEDPFA